MDTVTYPDSRVAQFIEQHFVAARVRVKDNAELVKVYLVGWTPNVVVLDDTGHIHYRVEGFLPPHDFIARLALGDGKYRLNRKQFARAAEQFEQVAQRHSGTEAGAEALYWLGVARYKETHDAAQLRGGWQRLAREYPNSEWTKRSNIP
jgi:hypothetical protein